MFERLFNWKKNPASVFVLAIPIFILGVGFLGVRAYLEWTLHSDPVYFYILAVGFALLAVALIPAYRMHKMNSRNQVWFK